MTDLIRLPRTSLWNLAEMDRDYARAHLPAFKNPIVLDIGSHAGIFALWALGEWEGATVICYEPHPELAAICRENLDGKEAIVHEKAVVGSSDEGLVGSDGKVAIYEGKRTLLGTSLYHLGWQQDAARHRVDWVHARELPPADCLKCDGEGPEVAILRDYRHGAGLKALLVETHRQQDWIELCQIAWGWGLEMALCNPGRNSCVTSAWVRR